MTTRDPYASFAILEDAEAPPARDAAKAAPAGNDPYAHFATVDESHKPESWGEWIVNSIAGHDDPKYADAAAGPTVGKQFPDKLRMPVAGGSLMGSSDAALGDIAQNALGDDFIRREKDANGYEVFVTRGPDGQEQRAYLNKPGLDMQDVGRAVVGAIPYVATGGIGAAAKGGMLAKTAVAGIAGATTKVATDVGGEQIGSQQPVDWEGAAVTGGLNALVPGASAAVSSAWRELVTIPGLINSATGQLTQRGIEAARRAGLDPQDFTPDFAKSFAREFARSGDEAAAAATATTDRFGIRPTRGQVTKDKAQLHREEAMRWGQYGDEAKDTINAFDNQQRKAINYAALGADESGAAPREVFAPRLGIGELINPTRRPGASPYDRQPATLGQSAKDTLVSARENARQADRALWDDSVTTLKPTPAALEIMPEAINPKIANVAIDNVNTPVAFGIRDQLTRFMRGQIDDAADTPFRGAPIQTVDQMRRRIGTAIDDAATNSDKRAAKALYDGFNDWIDQAASRSLLDGDPAGALQLAKARGFHRDVMNLFSPKDATGKPSAAALRLERILDGTKADSGEAVIDTLLGPAGAKSVTPGSIQALQNFKAVVHRFAPEGATQAWDDVRLAHWARMVTDRGGQMLGPTAIASNLKSTLQSQASLMQTLYTPMEQRQIREFLRAIETVSYKPPNASGSSYGVGNLVKDWVSRIASSVMGSRLAGTVAGVVADKSGIPKAASRAAARRILSQGQQQPPRELQTVLPALISPPVRDAWPSDQWPLKQ